MLYVHVNGTLFLQESNVVHFCIFQETKPSSGDGSEKKDGEYIKLKVIGQVREYGEVWMHLRQESSLPCLFLC